MRKSELPFTGNGTEPVQALVRIEALPDEPLAAAARFYAQDVPLIERALNAGDGSLAIVLPPAAKGHRGWIREAIASLARASAPIRVNGVMGGDGACTDNVLAWLETADGVTGQLLAVDSQTGGIAS